MGEFPHFPASVILITLWIGLVAIRACSPAPARARLGRVSGAAAADRPGPRSKPPGTAELLCALSYGSGLAASCLGLPAAEQDRLRRAGLVHDLGKIAVPHRLLEQAGDDTGAAGCGGGAAALAEPVRLHPYYAQRILSRVRPLADLVADVGAHHERLDGSGYPHGLAGPGIPIGARMLAAADVWAERAGQGPPDDHGSTRMIR
jgi:HD domain